MTAELMSVIHVASADGRVLYEGGGGGPALYPGRVLNLPRRIGVPAHRRRDQGLNDHMSPSGDTFTA